MKEQVGTSFPKNTWRQWKDSNQSVDFPLQAACVGTPASSLQDSWGLWPVCLVTLQQKGHCAQFLPRGCVPYKRNPISFLRHALHKHPLVNNYWYIITMEICINILKYINYWNKLKYINVLNGLPRWYSGEESTCQRRRHQRRRFDPWVGKSLYRRNWQPTPVFLPEKFQGQRILVGFNPWVAKSRSQLSMHAHTILSVKIHILWQDDSFLHTKMLTAHSDPPN